MDAPEQRRNILFRDNIGYFPEGYIHYPESLHSIATFLREIPREITGPAFGANLQLIVRPVVDFFENIHCAHHAAQRVIADYCASGIQYCLYLRNFSFGGRKFGSYQDGTGTLFSTTVYVPTDARMRSFVADKLDGLLSAMTCINLFDLRRGDGTGARTGFDMPAFRFQSHNWRVVIEELIKGANNIVLYVNDLAPGTAFEIDVIRRQSMQGRCAVVTTNEQLRTESRLGDFREVFFWESWIPDWAQTAEAERFTTSLRQLTRDGFVQTQSIQDLSRLKCYVVDRNIELAVSQFSDDILRGLNYEDYVPSSLANNWTYLWGDYPRMLEEWRIIEDSLTSGHTPPGVADVMDLGLRCFVLATTLELYEMMAVSLAIAGMARRVSSGTLELSKAFYGYAARFATLSGNESMARDYQEYADSPAAP